MACCSKSSRVQSSAACAATIGPCPLPPEAAPAADPDSLELGRKGQGIAVHDRGDDLLATARGLVEHRVFLLRTR